jgi:hypothetical protein
MSAHGEVKVEWHRENGLFTLDIDIPAEGFADVYFPYGREPVSVTAGHHHFTEPLPAKKKKKTNHKKTNKRR